MASSRSGKKYPAAPSVHLNDRDLDNEPEIRPSFQRTSKRTRSSATHDSGDEPAKKQRKTDIDVEQQIEQIALEMVKNEKPRLIQLLIDRATV